MLSGRAVGKDALMPRSQTRHEGLPAAAVSSLKLYGELVPYSRLAEEIMSVVGVVTHGLLLNGVTAAVIADGPEAKIVEKASLSLA